MSLDAEFSALPLSGPAPAEVQFTDESIVDGGSIITERLWTFDDGDTSADVNPLHEYVLPGLYSPSLKIINRGLGFQVTTAPTLSWEHLIYANGLFVAVDNGTGTPNAVMTSPDGINWTRRTTPAISGAELQAIVYDGSAFIIFAGNNSTKQLYSTDGITWIQRTMNDQFPLFGGAYGGGIYVITRGSIHYSTDAINWIYLSATSGWGRETTDYVNGNFVTIGNNGTGQASTFIGVSSNGSSWVQRAIPLSSLGRIAYGNGVHVLTRGRNPGSDQVMVSSDLITWNIHPVGLGSTLWNDITFDNGLFVMTANDVSGTKVATSPDGINWIGVTITGDAIGKVWRGVAGNDSGLYAIVNQNGDAAYSTIVELESDTELKTDYISASGIKADFSADPLTGSAPQKVQFTDESSYGGGSIITDRLWTFDDGKFSTDTNPLHEYVLPGLYSPSLKVIQSGFEFQITTSPSLQWNSMVYGAGLFVSLSTDYNISNRIMTSPDGINWTQRTTPSLGAGSANIIIYGGGEFIVPAQNATTSIISADGINWSLRAMNQLASGLDYGNGVYVLTQGSLYYSYDAVTWSIYVPSIGWNRLNIDFVNGNFVATGFTGGGAPSNFIAVSTNGTSWVTRTIPLTSAGGRVAYGNGVYVLTRSLNSSQVMTSTDLITWTPRETSIASTSWDDIIFDNGIFMMTSVVPSAVTKIASSLDGINWTGHTIVGDDPNMIWSGVAGNGSGLYAVNGNDGRTAYSTIVELESDTELKTDYIDIINSIIFLRRREAIDDGL